MKVKSESEVAQSCLTLSDPMDCSPPGSSIHGIFQARVVEWGAIAFSGLRLEFLKRRNYLKVKSEQGLKVGRISQFTKPQLGLELTALKK